MRILNYVKFLEGTAKDDKGRTIEDILCWEGKFFRLEFTHDYIQRIFPLPESSHTDRNIQPITAEELLELRNNEKAKKNIRRAYVMMLRFWELDGDKYKNLSIKRHWVRKNGKDHNLLRISRVLKCLKLVRMNEYDDFRMRIEYLLDLSEKGLFPLCDETKNIWRDIIDAARETTADEVCRI